MGQQRSRGAKMLDRIMNASAIANYVRAKLRHGYCAPFSGHASGDETHRRGVGA